MSEREELDWIQKSCLMLHPDLPEGWYWSRSEAVEGGFFIVTGFAAPLYKTGKRAGRRNVARRDRSTERTIIIQRADVDDLCAKYDAMHAIAEVTP